VAEGAPLLRAYRRNLIEGSNPSLSAIDYKRTFICSKWHSLKSPAFAVFFAICKRLALYKATPFFSNFSPIYTSFLKNTVLEKTKYRALHPHAHIYHYNHYETTPLKRSACRYAVCEEQLDNLLRNQKFVDLYLKGVRFHGIKKASSGNDEAIFDGQLDYLFIDEAGQVATANVVAMVTATKNIILVGDQMKIGQPMKPLLSIA